MESGFLNSTKSQPRVYTWQTVCIEHKAVEPVPLALSMLQSCAISEPPRQTPRFHKNPRRRPRSITECKAQQAARRLDARCEVNNPLRSKSPPTSSAVLASPTPVPEQLLEPPAVIFFFFKAHPDTPRSNLDNPIPQ